MSAIDIGPEAINRGTSKVAAGKTIICLDNPANDSGIITDVEIWAQTTVDSMTIAIFSGGGGAGEYTARSSAVLGEIVAGTKKSFSGLNLAVETGDYIGCYCTTGKHEIDESGFAGILEFTGDGTGGAETYTLDAGDAISIKGTPLLMCQHIPQVTQFQPRTIMVDR